MAMTLRLPADVDRAVSELAEARGVSKHEATVQAIMETAARDTKARRVDAVAEWAETRYANLLKRLAE